MSIKSSVHFLMKLNKAIKGLLLFALLILVSFLFLLLFPLEGALFEEILKWMFKSIIIAAAIELILSIICIILRGKSKQMDNRSLSVKRMLLLSILMVAIVAFEFGICFIGVAVPHM